MGAVCAPWLEQWVEHNDPQTGRVELVKVLRSDPAGVSLMKKYPDIGIDPGVTPIDPGVGGGCSVEAR